MGVSGVGPPSPAGIAVDIPTDRHPMTGMLRHWFLFALGAVILAAWMHPGLGASWSWLTWVLVPLIFLCAGVTLPGSELRRALGTWRLHAAIQMTAFGLLPPIFVAAAWFVTQQAAPSALSLGLIILGCLPATITSCVVFTRESGGDEASAVVNAALGNLLAIGLTPLLVVCYSGQHGQINASAAVGALLLQVALPMAVGQVARRWLTAWATAHKSQLGVLGNLCLVILIWQAFSSGFLHGLVLSGGLLALTAAVVVGLHALAFAIPLALGLGLRFARPQCVALTVCGSQKTIALGIPLIHLLMAGHPDAALVTVPLLLYSPLQLVVASCAAPYWRRWVASPHRGS